MTEFILKSETNSAQVKLNGKNTKTTSVKLADWILSNEEFQKYHYEETETGLSLALQKWLKKDTVENPVKINTEKYIIEMELNSKENTLQFIFRGYNKLKSVKKRVLAFTKEIDFDIITLNNHTNLC